MRCQPKRLFEVYNWLKYSQFCALCDARTDMPHGLCGACEAELPWLVHPCMVCALPLTVADRVCGACLKRPPAFDRVHAPWRYAFPLDTLITRFKHQANWPLGRLLADWQARHLRHAFAEGLARPHSLLPVPLSRARQRRRGFNQAELLARQLGRSLDLPVCRHGLRRHLDTPAQQGLDAAARRRNLRHAFALDDSLDVAGRHLALVDDVLTTGATAEHLARLLKKAGAARVDVYCLARTPKPGG